MQMILDRLLASVERTRGLDPAAIRRWARRFVAELAVQDWFVFAYLMVLIVAVLLAPASPGRTMNLQRFSGLTLGYVFTLLAMRGGLVRKGRVASLIYRGGLLGVVLGSYFMLRGLLPVVNQGALDASLYAFDLRVFGFEPTLWMDRFVTSTTTEWFSFFYYSYFFLISCYVLPLLFVGRRMKQFAEFSLGFMGVYIIAHIVYMLVPGYGPFRFLADQYTHSIPMGFWYQRVLEAVNGAGAQKDIFPSLHTAGPTFCFLFALRHRRKAPFKYVWPITGFFAANIVIATMFLRWHYLIDIVAGLSLATGVSIAAHYIAEWEHGFRLRRGLQPLWTSLVQGLPEPSSSTEQDRASVSHDAAPAR